MAKVSVTIPDNDLPQVEQAAKSAGVSVSAFVAKAASKAASSVAMRSARSEYDAYLLDNPDAAEMIQAARERALVRGRVQRRSTIDRYAAGKLGDTA